MKTHPFLLLGIVCTVLFSACGKEDDEEINVPVVYTEEIDVLGDQSVHASAIVSEHGGAEVTERGFCWSTSPEPTIETALHKKVGAGTGPFSSLLDEDFAPGQHYYIRGYARNKAGVGYGNQLDFTTLELKSIDYYGATIFVHPNDIAPYFIWGPPNQWIGADSPGYGSGNTIDIVNHLGPLSTAAKKCSDLVYYGHEDWYLPARMELEALYEEREYLGNFVTEGLQAKYWSSTEVDAANAYAVDFSNGDTLTIQKNSQLLCRCIRKIN